MNRAGSIASRARRCNVIRAVESVAVRGDVSEMGGYAACRSESQLLREMRVLHRRSHLLLCVCYFMVHPYDPT